ncbi:SusC/RagA family TonB-linked outer membrane protein [Sphingobacterium bambusae]|uniref:TonB-dependent receptor n=1 Tax=Sphingobacterium bambusae TaxID=662858 RepID=A0ABW6BI97_9SPHI|nr:TonB-dependent receptor [Sphingobacterium bambusae]WPL50917.1 TonB-dependent receptor [Sphingobacterium bambusae]
MKNYCMIGLLCLYLANNSVQAKHLSKISFVQELNQKPITLTYQNKTKLSVILNDITKQSAYSFIVSEQQIASLYIERINLRNQTLQQVLDYLSEQLPLRFKTGNRSVSVQVLAASNTRQQTISGTVSDANGKPLAGVTIVEQQGNSATRTGNAGEFTLKTSKPSGLIDIRFLGFVSQERAFASSTSLMEITLQEEMNLLNDVVVVGYGTQRKSSVTGAISSLRSEDVTAYAGGTMAEAISGRAAGVQVVQSSAMPGVNSKIKLRGTGTLTAGTDPLVVIDGFPMTEGTGLNAIDPNTIKSIEFLKDAASTAIYGSRGANGVIMVETKQGSSDKLTVSLNSFLGYQQRADAVKFVDAYDMAQFMYESRNTGYVSRDPVNRSESDDTETRRSRGASLRELIPGYLAPYLAGEPGLTNTNWLNEIFRTAPMTSHTLTVMGGDQKTNYAVIGNYFKQDGIIIGSDYERYSTNFNLRSNFSKRFKFGLTANPSYNKRNLFNNNGSWETDPLAIAMISYPFFAPYDAAGDLNISQQIRENTPTDGALGENPLAMIQMIDNTRDEFKLFGNTYLSVDLLKGLTFKTSLGGDYSAISSRMFDPSTVGTYRQAAPDATRASSGTILRKNFLTENILSYVQTFGVNNLEAIAGHSYQYEYLSTTAINAFNFQDDQLRNVMGGTSFQVLQPQTEWTMLSYFGRINYNYDNRYLISGSIRRDGSSRFGANTKWSVFPAVSAGWTLSEESFFNTDNKIIQYAKFRASWGKTGNNQIPQYGAHPLLSIENYLDGNDALAGGVGLGTAPNPNLSWEVAESTNVGVDMYVVNNLLNISADYYVTNTNDLLLSVPVPRQSGYTSSLQNIGRVRNWGFELQLGTNKPILLGAVSWKPAANLSTNRNKVLALGDGQTQIITGTNNFALTRVGGPIAQMYGYQVTGIYKSQAEINEGPAMAGTLVGDYIIADLNGDGVIDAQDKTTFGTGAPTLLYGTTHNFKYKQFDLSFTLQGEAGKKIYSRVLSTVISVGEGFAVPSQDYFDNRYHPVNNPNGTYATPNLGNFSNNRRETRASNVFFDNANYLRLRDVRLSYSLAEKAARMIGLSRLQLYASANNLFTITPYKGFSVDASTDNPLTQGYDNSNYPVARTFLVGLNLTL